MSQTDLYNGWDRDGITNEILSVGSKKFNKPGGTRKIKDAELPCMHPEHNPPSHMVYEPGTYEHTCPSCGKSMIFTVPLVWC